MGAARRRRKGRGEGGGKEKKNGGKGRRNGGKERGKERRKEKRKGEEERKKKEEEEGVLCSEQTRTAKNPELRYKRQVSSYSDYFMSRGHVMDYGFRPVFRANLDMMWFVCDCVMFKDQFYRVLGLSKTEHCVLGWQNPEQNGKQGCAQISAHPCESAASTLDGHNFLVRTLICVFLDSTESSLSIEFNKIKFSTKMWAEHWAGSRIVEE